MSDAVSAFDIKLFTDAAGSDGFGAYCKGHWCSVRWAVTWVEKGWVRNLALLELFPILVSVVVWGGMIFGIKRFVFIVITWGCRRL